MQCATQIWALPACNISLVIGFIYN